MGTTYETVKLVRQEIEQKELAEFTNTGTRYMDRESSIVSWSPEIFEMFGLDTNSTPPTFEVQERYYSPESWKLLSYSVDRVIKRGIPYELELKVITANGQKGWIWTKGKAVKDQNGKIVGLWGAARNITTRVKDTISLSQTLADAEENEESQSITPVKSYQNQINALNRELLSSNEKLQVLNEELTVTNEELEQSNEEHRITNQELQLLNSNLTDANEELVRLNKLNIEKESLLISQKRKLKISNDGLESLLRITQYKTENVQKLLDYALSEIIKITKSKIGYIYYYSEEKQQFSLNTWSKEVMNDCEVLNPQTIYNLSDTGCWGEAVRKRRPIVINDYRAKNKLKKGIPGGHVALKRFLTIPVFVDEQIVAVTGVANKTQPYDKGDIRQLTLMMDSVWKIAERVSIIRDLKEAQLRAEESDKLKSAFLANMSHEIRTPLNGIIGFTEILKDSDLGKENDNYLSIIQRSGERLLELVNNIVDISRIESGQIEPYKTSVNISEGIRMIHDQFMPEFQKKGLKHSIEIDDSLESITTDKSFIYSILSNLIKNAIKFTEKGTITIGCIKGDDHIKFYVKDTGYGIKKRMFQKIFDRFNRDDEINKNLKEGSGLGLSISKSYVELLGGNIWVESDIGVGSTFYFTIPDQQ